MANTVVDVDMEPEVHNVENETPASTEKDDDVLSLGGNEGRVLSQSSDDTVTVTINPVAWPPVPQGEANSGARISLESEGGKPKRQRNKRKKGNVNGSEKAQFRRGRDSSAVSGQSGNVRTDSRHVSNKRGRSPNGKEKLTPPSKRILDSTPPVNRETANYKQAVADSMTFYIIGAEQALTTDQVERVMENLVWELEKFIGSGKMAPSFNDNKPGESELKLECADERTMKWLVEIFPRLRPWRLARLKLVTKAEWEAEYKPKRMLRMSVVVPWRATATYFMQVLRSNNPFLKTRNWEVRHSEDWGDRTKFYLKVDETSVEMLRERNFRVHWLLNVITFRLDRPGTGKQQEKERAEVSETTAAKDSSTATTSTVTSGPSTDTTTSSMVEGQTQVTKDRSESTINAPNEPVETVSDLATVESSLFSDRNTNAPNMAAIPTEIRTVGVERGVANIAIQGGNTEKAKSVYSSKQQSKPNRFDNRWVWGSPASGTPKPISGNGNGKVKSKKVSPATGETSSENTAH